MCSNNKLDGIKMKIADIEFGKYPVFLAPMEDVTDEAFRLLCKRFGVDMVYTEFVSSDALIRDVNSTLRKLNIYDQERPVASSGDRARYLLPARPAAGPWRKYRPWRHIYRISFWRSCSSS